MPPLSTILAGIETAIKYEPQVLAVLKDLFGPKEPTETDWAAARLKVAMMDYDALVPNAKLLANLDLK